jgi:hypothetical protein
MQMQRSFVELNNEYYTVRTMKRNRYALFEIL